MPKNNNTQKNNTHKTVKSAKDIAFDKERAKYRQEIRRLESELNKTNAQLLEIKQKADRLESELAQKQDWIDRLLEYTEMSESDMKAVLDKDKNMSQFFDNMNSIKKLFSGMRV